MTRSNPDFGHWLDITMQNKQMTGGELARQMDVNESVVSRWRNGKSVPGLNNIFNLAKVFNVEPLRLAVTAGVLPEGTVKVKPLPLPDPKPHLSHVYKQLEALRGVSVQQREAMFQAYRDSLKNKSKKADQ
jgi:transcriptional regulator with XRE-family HTH domain